MTINFGAQWDRRMIKFQRSWDKVVFNQFLHSDTISHHDAILASAETSLANFTLFENDEAYANSDDPTVQQGWELKKRIQLQFKNIHGDQPAHRILIQVPVADHSPAGFSLFTNIAESFEFLGIPTRILDWNENIGVALESFNPTLLLSSDDQNYLKRIDWSQISAYRQSRSLKIGLTASLEEYGNSPLSERIHWAKDHGIDFFYSFRDRLYVQSKNEYRLFHESNFPILYLPFGANILHYYPVAGFSRDLNFAIMATRKSEHASYLKKISMEYSGFIDGPGWKHVDSFKFNRDRDRYIYARAKVGLNIHLPEQNDAACEVNERTHQVAVCGVPQLMDHPKLIDSLYDRDSFYISDSPNEFSRLFRTICNESDKATLKALNAQRQAFEKHTTFHRADNFLKQLAAIRC